MSAVPVEMEIVDESREFFAPVASDLIDSLIGQYSHMRGKIETIANFVNGDEFAGAMRYFLDGNRESHRYLGSPNNLFQLEGAVKSLNATYWSKTLALTDVLDCMPQKRRDEWNKSISEMTAPDFNEESVRPTISGLLAQRQTFFAERVDGIFRSLSGDHVTNIPQGFGKRMIMNYVITSYDTVNHTQGGHINDLRCVIAKFMGRDEPKWDASSAMIQIAKRRPGEWITLDGGALRLRVYKKGTGHLEIHPDMVYRLNQVLAHLYPMAIPAEFRTKPRKPSKEFKLVERPLSFAVVSILAGMRSVNERVGSGYPERYAPRHNCFSFDYGQQEKSALAEAKRVLEGIGGVPYKNGWGYDFDYDPKPVLDDIVCSGCIPDQKTHQYYPTRELVATDAVERAQVGPSDECCEPSAGQGGIADYMPKGRTRCVEISDLHCKILEAKGHNVVKADFIEWAATTNERFDVIVMNPPFSEGRAMLHLKAAMSLLRPGGRFSAVLPASLKNSDIAPGWNVEWSDVYSDEFAGTGVSVIIACGNRP